MCAEKFKRRRTAVCAELSAELPTELHAELPSELHAEPPPELPAELHAELPSELHAELPAELHAELPAAPQLPVGEHADCACAINTQSDQRRLQSRTTKCLDAERRHADLLLLSEMFWRHTFEI